MVIWKRTEDLQDGSTRTKIKFAWFPKFEFDDRKSSGKEKGDLFWLEKYILTQHFNSRPTFRKWRKYQIVRSKIAVYNELKK